MTFSSEPCPISPQIIGFFIVSNPKPAPPTKSISHIMTFPANTFSLSGGQLSAWLQSPSFCLLPFHRSRFPVIRRGCLFLIPFYPIGSSSSESIFCFNHGVMDILALSTLPVPLNLLYAYRGMLLLLYLTTQKDSHTDRILQEVEIFPKDPWIGSLLSLKVVHWHI